MHAPIKIEESKRARFGYERFKFFSKQLNLDVHFGRLLPLEVTEAQGTIYILHGGNGDDKQPLEAGLPETLSEKTLEILTHHKLQIVLPWVGATCLSSKIPKTNANYERYFLNELLPFAEIGIKSAISPRYIAGYSLGGQAAFNFCMRHPTLFKGVGAIFPTFVRFNPFEPQQIQDFSDRNNVTSPWLDVLTSGFTDTFESANHFYSHDPLSLLDATSNVLSSKKIYVGVGDKDQFALNEGCSEFSKKLSALNINHKFNLDQGGEHGAPLLIKLFPEMIETLIGLS